MYEENSKEIRSVLGDMSMGLPHYQDMEWRVDIRTGSRALLRQVDPTIVMRLHTKDEG